MGPPGVLERPRKAVVDGRPSTPGQLVEHSFRVGDYGRITSDVAPPTTTVRCVQWASGIRRVDRLLPVTEQAP